MDFYHNPVTVWDYSTYPGPTQGIIGQYAEKPLAQIPADNLPVPIDYDDDWTANENKSVVNCAERINTVLVNQDMGEDELQAGEADNCQNSVSVDMVKQTHTK